MSIKICAKSLLSMFHLACSPRCSTIYQSRIPIYSLSLSIQFLSRRDQHKRYRHLSRSFIRDCDYNSHKSSHFPAILDTLINYLNTQIQVYSIKINKQIYSINKVKKIIIVLLISIKILTRISIHTSKIILLRMMINK